MTTPATKTYKKPRGHKDSCACLFCQRYRDNPAPTGTGHRLDNDDWAEVAIPTEPVTPPPARPRALGFAARMYDALDAHLLLTWHAQPSGLAWEAYADTSSDYDASEHRYTILVRDHPQYPYRLYIEGTESLEFSTVWGSLADAQTAAQWDWAYGRYYHERDMANEIRSIWRNAIQRNITYGPEPGAPQPASGYRYPLPNPLRSKEANDA